MVDSMTRTWLPMGAAGTVLTGLLVFLLWLAWPSPPAPPALQPSAQTAAAPRDPRPRRPHPARAPHEREAPREPRVKAKAQRGPTKEPEIEPDERAGLREEMREERLGSLSDRLDAYADEAGLDPQATERVRDVMIDTTDRITRDLARVDRGEATWDEVRRDLRQYRLDQANKVRKLLGDDQFDDLVQGMGLERFMGEEPIRGRLE